MVTWLRVNSLSHLFITFVVQVLHLGVVGRVELLLHAILDENLAVLAVKVIVLAGLDDGLAVEFLYAN